MSSTPLHLIEIAAHEGAFGQNLTPEPSAARCRAGNYRMGRVDLNGLNLVIEQPRGSTRSGVDEKTGKAWSSRMAAHYGYIGGTTGADGDGVDCFIGPYPDAERAYVINQNVGGKFDEHKVMLAFPDLASARSAYLNSYERGWDGLESILPASLSQLKWWLKNGDLKRPLRADTLPKEGLETMKKTHWNTDAQPYDTTLAQVLYDIRRSDDGEGLLLDAVTAQDIIDDAEGVLAFDALVVPYAKLERRMELLRGIMARTGDKVKPVALQITEQRAELEAQRSEDKPDLRTFAAATNSELYDPDYRGGQWMIEAMETQEGIADFVAASANYQEATKPKFGQIAGFKFVAFSKVQMRKGEQRRQLSVIDLGFERFALNTDLTGFDYQAWDGTYSYQTAAADQKAVDRALFQSVIDGTVPDILEPSLADNLEAAFNRNQGDQDMVNLFELAVGAYQNAMLAATANLS